MHAKRTVFGVLLTLCLIDEVLMHEVLLFLRSCLLAEHTPMARTCMQFFPEGAELQVKRQLWRE